MRRCGPGDGFVALVQGAIGLLDAVPVVVERAERKQLGERGQSADVIGVPMADDHVVDPRQAHRSRCGDDALRVAVVVAREAGVEQERLSVGRGEECGGASLDIDPGNLQTTAAGLGQRRADEGEHADECRSKCTCHVLVSIEQDERLVTQEPTTTGEYLSTSVLQIRRQPGQKRQPTSLASLARTEVDSRESLFGCPSYVVSGFSRTGFETALAEYSSDRR